jgi:hypothetical protein
VTHGPTLGLLLLALSACDVSEIPPVPSDVAINDCDSNEDCPGGFCSDGACVTGSTALRSVLLEVTPQSSDVLSPLPYLVPLADSPSADLVLQPPVTVSGYVTLHPETGCTPLFLSETPGTVHTQLSGTIPVKATFTSSAGAFGLPTPVYESDPLVGDERDGGRHGFKIIVPPGEYDVYLEPPATTPESNCKIPPWLLLRQRIGASGPFEIKLSKPLSLTVPVHWATASLDFFKVEMIDPDSGRVLSTSPILGNPGLDGDGRAFYQATLGYSQVLEPNAMNELVVSKSSYELVRISPPEGTTAPSIMGEASAIGLTASNEGGLLLSSPLPPPVVVEAQTAEAATTRPVGATVTVTATRIEGMDRGLYASFIRTYRVEARDKLDEDGNVITKAGTFKATLPPGDYVVDSIPKASSAPCSKDGCFALAARRDLWQVAAMPVLQAGKLIQFQRAPTVRGAVVSASGEPVTGATVRVNPAHVRPTPDRWNQIDTEGRAVPFSTTGIVDGRGAFDFQADPGTFNLFVQPDPSTRFGWYVRSQFTVDERDAVLSTGTLALPLARRHVGRVVLGAKGPDQPRVPNALIRAYVYVTPSGEYAAAAPENGALLQVAETRSNGAGEFELLIPATLDSPSQNAD